MSVTVIINPTAGGSRSSLPPGERVALVERGLRRRGLTGRIELTRAAGHGSELARRAVESGCPLVVAWGGDGTINEVASQLLGTATTLGVVRAGSGNGLARELRIPARPERALDIALAGRDRMMDAGEIEGRPFLNVAGIGFDAAMAARFNDLGAERRGGCRYALLVARTFASYRASHYRLLVDGRQLEVDALVVAIANLPQYGARVVIAPGARQDDGLLDVVVVGDRGTLGRVGLMPRLYDRTIHKAADVAIYKAATVSVETDQPILFHVDGETQTGHTRVEARVRPGALRVRVPPTAAG
jgi:diacylglycerol kinase (ATP)